MSLSATQITRSRADEQWSMLGLAILQPATVLACQVTDYTGTDMVNEVGYGNVTAGSYSDVIPGQICFVGSTPGAYDLGICRVRKAWTAATAYFSEESSIAFADGVYLTVVDAMDVRPKHLVVTSDEVFMDVDVDYSDQHEDFDPVPVMGGQVVLDVDSYPATVTFPDVADSWVFDSTITAYLTAASAGVVTDETTTNPTLTVSSYPTNGYIRVSTTVTAANGKSFTGYRYVFVFDPDHRPITDFVLDSCSVDRETGGWSARVVLDDPNDYDLVRVGGLAVIYSKDYFDGEEGVVGLETGRENVWISGWVWEYTSVNDPEFQPRGFDIHGAHFWMQNMASFPVGVELSANAATVWTECEGLTVDKGLFHFLHFRSTVTQVMDVYLTDDTRYSPVCESAAGTLWDQLYDIAYSQILAIPLCSHNGKLVVKVPYNLIPSADRASHASLVMALDADQHDFERQVEIKRTAPRVSQVLLNGVSVDVYGNGFPFFSLSPGHTPALLGDLLPMPNLLLASQTQSNQLAGLVFASQNNPYDDIPVTLNGNNRAFDIAPLLYGTISNFDEYSGVVIPTAISYSHDRQNGKNKVEINFEGETSEADAIYVNGDIPDGEGGFIPLGGLGPLPPIGPIELPDFPPIGLPTVPGTEVTTDCSGGVSNFFPLQWSKPSLIGNDSDKLVATALFPCKLRSSYPGPSYIDFYSVYMSGDAAQHINVYAIQGGSRILTASLVQSSNVWSFRAYFNVVSDTLVDGFEIELDFGGWTQEASISVYSEFACTTEQVNDFTVRVQELAAGNFSVGLSVSAACTVHAWLPPGFIGRIARSNTYNPANLNWIMTRGGTSFQGLTDGNWIDGGARDPFNDWHQYNTSEWLEVASVSFPASNITKLVNGVGTAEGTIIEINYNTWYYLIAGTLGASRYINIFGSALNNVCAP